MRGQRRGLLRSLFAAREGRRAIYVGLASGLSEASARRLRRVGIDAHALRRIRTDLALAPGEVDGLVALGEALTLERLSGAGL